MSLKLIEIITRDLSAPIEEEESLFVLKEYVRLRKGKDINPVIITEVPVVLLERQLLLMSKLALHATVWFKNNLDKIK